jgi:hypothetical protein
MPTLRLKKSRRHGHSPNHSRKPHPGADADVTADDLSPETLLDAEPSHTHAAVLQRVPLNTVLRDGGPDEVAAGEGEAELSQHDFFGSDDTHPKPEDNSKRSYLRHPFRRGRGHRRPRS